jgi:porphobilinogen synthase
MGFPIVRMRRTRRNESMRLLVRERRLSPAQLIAPLFAVHGSGVRTPLSVLPGNYRLSIDAIADEAADLYTRGIRAALLFGIPRTKDSDGSEASAPDGILQQAVAAIKKRVPGMIVIADTCMSMFTPNGSSGLVRQGVLLNDESLERLCAIAVSQVRAGADMVAPSAMLDGQIGALRTALDANGFSDAGIMAYAAKFASCLYNPFFNQGGEPAVDFGIKRSHQLDIPNGDEAMREIELDIQEGADMVMVKPGLWYLDIVWRAKQRFGVPLAVYNVSGECAMLAAAAADHSVDQDSAIMESLYCCLRAGADMIITYFARRATELLPGV